MESVVGLAFVVKTTVHQKLENELADEVNVFVSYLGQFSRVFPVNLKLIFKDIVAGRKQWRTKLETSVLEVKSPRVELDGHRKFASQRLDVRPLLFVVVPLVESRHR